MSQAAALRLGIQASDVSRQKTVRTRVPRDATVGELVQGLLAKMGLMRRDAEGGPLQYRARLEREGRHLNDSELVGDALEEDDSVVLHPRVDAGRTCRSQ